MSSSFIQAGERFVTDLLQNKLSPDLGYHDLRHTREVWDAVRLIGEKTGVSEADMEILELAALFHDVGYTEIYDGHEEISKQLAASFLKKQNFPSDKLEKVLACIDATRYKQEPRNQLEAIVCDADLSNLGSEDYLAKLAELRREWVVFKGEVHSDEDWRKLNRQFFKQHRYYTEAARELYTAKKESNLALMKDPKKKKGDKKPNAPLASSKSVQVMFKTALRNHIDLTNLADNKANIMLSINAIIITITIPLMPSYLEEDMSLLVPAVILLLTCIVSIIFATLATRPISMKGMTSEEQIRTGKSNLFFFGNFYKMGIHEYKAGMKEVINSEGAIEDSAISDLYYLGAALGNKYKLLRTCYTIFMIGMTLTVVAFAVAKTLRPVWGL